MRLMLLEHLKASIRLVKNDLRSLSSPLISRDAAKQLEAQARAKLSELQTAYRDKAVL